MRAALRSLWQVAQRGPGADNFLVVDPQPLHRLVTWRRRRGRHWGAEARRPVPAGAALGHQRILSSADCFSAHLCWQAMASLYVEYGPHPLMTQENVGAGPLSFSLMSLPVLQAGEGCLADGTNVLAAHYFLLVVKAHISRPMMITPPNVTTGGPEVRRPDPGDRCTHRLLG